MLAKQLEVSDQREIKLKERLSAKCVPTCRSDKETGNKSISKEVLMKCQDLADQFPPAPQFTPQRTQEREPPATYMAVSSSAIKAMSFGFGSLRRGLADRLGGGGISMAKKWVPWVAWFTLIKCDLPNVIMSTAEFKMEKESTEMTAWLLKSMLFWNDIDGGMQIILCCRFQNKEGLTLICADENERERTIEMSWIESESITMSCDRGSTMSSLWSAGLCFSANATLHLSQRNAQGHEHVHPCEAKGSQAAPFSPISGPASSFCVHGVQTNDTPVGEANKRGVLRSLVSVSSIHAVTGIVPVMSERLGAWWHATYR